MGLVLFDTNILIDHFNGIPEATDEIAYYRNTAISAITWAEVAVKLDTAGMAEFELLVAALPIYVLHTTMPSYARPPAFGRSVSSATAMDWAASSRPRMRSSSPRRT